MKSFFYFILSILICAILCGSGVMLYKTILVKSPPIEQGNVNIKEEDGNFDPPPENGNMGYDENEDLREPANEALLIANGLSMRSGASLYLGDGNLDTPASLRFSCLVDNALVEEVQSNSNKKLAIMCAPLDTYNAVNVENNTYVDWIKTFDKAGKSVIVEVINNFVDYDANSKQIMLTVEGIPYENYNRRYLALGVLMDKSSGDWMYQYSAMPEGKTYQDIARSVAYVAGGTLNGQAMGTENLTEAQQKLMWHYIDMAVDNANGLTEPTINGDVPEVTTPLGTRVKMGFGGGSTKVPIFIAPKGVDVPIYYKLANTGVISLSDTGEIIPQSYGSAVVYAYALGVEYRFTIEVSQYISYA